MFDSSSRYAGLPLEQYTNTAGNVITYVSRRFSPQPDTMSVLTQTTVRDQERLDQITTRTLGNPLLFWLVADANDGMDPWDLVQTPGSTLIIPQPQS
jgi:hypothetical protein